MIALVQKQIIRKYSVRIFLLLHRDKQEIFRKLFTVLKQLFSEFFIKDDRLRFGNTQYAENIVKRKLLVRRYNNADSAADCKIARAPLIAVHSGNRDFCAAESETEQRRAESLNISLVTCVAYIKNLTDLIFNFECGTVSVKLLTLIEQLSEIMKFSYFIIGLVHLITLPLIFPQRQA